MDFQLRLDSITKQFPGVVALDNVSIGIRAGDCHALIGENGAGKSTLGKIIAGIYRADSGRMLLDGKHVAFSSPFEAKLAGVSMVHQELLYCANLPVAENLFLGSLPHTTGIVNRRVLAAQARKLLADIGVEVDVWRPVEELSIAQRQLVQIAGAIGTGSRIIIMDEPTSSLTQKETERLFSLLADLRSRGVTIIYVSHRMEEVLRVTQRISVLRDGAHVKTIDTSETGEDEIVHLMVGRAFDKYFPQHLDRGPGKELLRVERLSLPGRFRDISFSVNAGEIVGLCGLVGAGRSEVARAVFGLEEDVRGDIFVDGAKVKIHSASDAMRLGIGLVPEDRKLQGLILDMTAAKNLTLAMLREWETWGFFRQGREHDLVDKYFDTLSIKPRSPSVPVTTFSGGNQQKIVVAKWLARNCRILIVDEPTRGIDVKAKSELHGLLDDLAAQGKGVLLISSELPELVNLSTRIVVLREGVVRGEMPRAEVTQEKLIRLMAGVGSGAS